MNRDKIAGCFYGLAFGDAIGRNTEFTYNVQSIWRRYGATGYIGLPHPALFTDDTQMTLAVARALDIARNLSPTELARTTRIEFSRWAVEDERRAPGRTCMNAIYRMQRTRWQDATIAGSKGCGANMRVAPAAFLADVDTAIGYAQLQAAMTHGHPTAIAATELTALAIRWAAEDASRLEDLPLRVLRRARAQRNTWKSYRAPWLGQLAARRWRSYREAWINGWDENIQVLDRVYRALQNGYTPSDPCDVSGEGWIAEEALATALYCAVRWDYDPMLAVSMAARTRGDSDSLASITGAIVGAHYGENIWPVDWCDRIERRDDIEDAIETVYRLS